MAGDVDAVVLSGDESDPPKLVDISKSGESVQDVGSCGSVWVVSSGELE